MDAAGYGHFRVWKDRAYLAKLALIPFLVKLASIVAVMVLEYPADYLKQGLVMLPSLCAIGWMLAHYTRTLLLNERRPTTMNHMGALVRLGGVHRQNALKFVMWRARGIVASVLIYVFFGLISYVLIFLINSVVAIPIGGEGAQPLDSGGISPNISSNISADMAGNSSAANLSPLVSLLMLGAGIGVMGAAFWSFRLVWLYIPLAVLYPMREYMYQVRGFMSSLRYLALFFCCMAPASFAMMLVVRLIFTIFGGGDAAATDGIVSLPINVQIARFLIIGVQSFTEILLALISTTGFAWAMRGFLPRAKDTFNDFPSFSIKD